MQYSLYSYVFRVNRENATILEERVFEAPPKENSDELNHHLKHAQTYAEWSYHQKVRELNEKEKKIEDTFVSQKKKFEQDEEDVAKSLIRFVQSDAYGSDEPLSEEVNKRFLLLGTLFKRALCKYFRFRARIKKQNYNRKKPCFW